MNGVVGPLEEPELAVLRQLEARVPVIFARQSDQALRGNHHRGGDVVLHLHLVGRDEVLPQLVGPPGAVLLAADPEVVGDELAPLVFEFVAGGAVDDVDAEVLTPIIAPLGPVEALDHEDQRAHVVRNALEPGIVLGRELGGVGREQLDHRAERALRRQDRPRRTAAVAAAQIGQACVIEVPAENLFDQRHVLFEAAHVERAGQHGVHQAFADLRLAAA